MHITCARGVRRPHAAGEYKSQRQREDRGSELGVEAWLSRMLDLALVPVGCDLHINDGGISAERENNRLCKSTHALPDGTCTLTAALSRNTDGRGGRTINPVVCTCERGGGEGWGVADGGLYNAVSTSSIYFWLQLSSYRKYFEAASRPKVMWFGGRAAQC